MGTFDIPAADQEMFQRGGVELKKGGGGACGYCNKNAC